MKIRDKKTKEAFIKYLKKHPELRFWQALSGFSRQAIFFGEITGTIGYKIEGENGFGWDKVFIPKGYTKTLASLSIEEKNTISHRGKALAKFSNFIHKYYKML